jgi:hypothetical protein
MKHKTKYEYWSEEEKHKLAETVERVTKASTYTSWTKVAALMKPRTKQQCKSLFQILGPAYKPQ